MHPPQSETRTPIAILSIHSTRAPRTIPVFSNTHTKKFFYYYTNSFCFVKPDYSAVLNNAVERYLSPESGRSATIIFPFIFMVSWLKCLLPLMRHLMKYLQVFLRFLQMFFLPSKCIIIFNCNNFIIYLCIQYLLEQIRHLFPESCVLQVFPLKELGLLQVLQQQS